MAFGSFDKDGDGKISHVELTDIILRQYKYLADMDKPFWTKMVKDVCIHGERDVQFFVVI